MARHTPDGRSFPAVLACLGLSGLWLLLPDALVSSPVRAISGHGVFGLFPLQDQVKQHFRLGLRAKAANLVSPAAELAEETFQQVGGADPALVRERPPQVVEGQVKVFHKAAHRFGFKKSPLLLEVKQALFDSDDIRSP
jgi:hypothetical protein